MHSAYVCLKGYDVCQRFSDNTISVEYVFVYEAIYIKNKKLVLVQKGIMLKSFIKFCSSDLLGYYCCHLVISKGILGDDDNRSSNDILIFQSSIRLVAAYAGALTMSKQLN